MKNQQKGLLVIGLIISLAACWWMLIRPSTVSSVDKDGGATIAVLPSQDMAKDPLAEASESNVATQGASSAETSQPLAQQPSQQGSQPGTSPSPESASINANSSMGKDLIDNRQEGVTTSPPANNSTVDAQPPTAKTPSQGTSFPGIKQEMSDVMLAQLSHQPGNGEDSFVAIFQRIRGQGEFNGNAWIIADYVQRGTTEMMAMPSHADLHLTPDGAPKNPRTGVRLVLEDGVGHRLSKRFTIKRPGFEGEEISAVRVGIFDRDHGKIHIAKVSAIQWNKKRALKRARVGVP